MKTPHAPSPPSRGPAHRSPGRLSCLTPSETVWGEQRKLRQQTEGQLRKGPNCDGGGLQRASSHLILAGDRVHVVKIPRRPRASHRPGSVSIHAREQVGHGAADSAPGAAPQRGLQEPASSCRDGPLRPGLFASLHLRRRVVGKQPWKEAEGAARAGADHRPLAVRTPERRLRRRHGVVPGPARHARRCGEEPRGASSRHCRAVLAAADCAKAEASSGPGEMRLRVPHRARPAREQKACYN